MERTTAGRGVRRIAMAVSLASALGATRTIDAAEIARPAAIDATKAKQIEERLKASGPQVVRVQPITLDVAPLVKRKRGTAAPPLQLTLFGDLTLDLKEDRVIKLGPDTHDWIGKIPAIPNGRVVLSVKGKRAFGLIQAGNRLFEIRPEQQAGLHAVVEIDQTKFVDDHDDTSGGPTQPKVRKVVGPVEFETGIPLKADVGATQIVPSELAVDLSVIPEPMTRGPIINVLIGYTNEAEAAAGSSDIELVAQNAVAVANTTYEDSGIHQRLNLVGVVDLDYAEGSSTLTQLRDRLQDPDDDHMDGILKTRDQLHADIVSVFITDAKCGKAFIMNPVGVDFAEYGVNVVTWSCAVGNFSFAHELGHNMSARHDRGVDGTENSPYSYNHAYTRPSSGWRTVMAYNDACEAAGTSCTRLGKWSNPDRSHEGNATGESDTDNRKTLNNTANVVAGFRQLGKNEANDLYGSSFASGDFDGDGLMDVVIGAPTESPGSDPASGWASVYRGTPFGLASWHGLGQGTLDSNELDDRFGVALAAGDFNGDGRDDLAVGAPGEKIGSGPKSGRIYVFKGTTSGLKAWVALGQDGMGANEAGDLFGEALAAADFDGDGKDDLAVGAPGEKPGDQPRSGWVFLFKGGSSGLSAWKDFGQGGLGTNDEGDLFGVELAAGDFNGDKKADLVVGAVGEARKDKPKSGWVYVFKGSSSGLSSWKHFGQEGLGKDEKDDLFGHALAAGDFDGDGKDDLAVGAPGESPPGKSKTGWVFTYRGKSDGLSPWKGFGQSGLGADQENDAFGWSLAAGDFGGDGKDDLVVGAPGDKPDGASGRSGAAFSYKGGSSGLAAWKAFGQAGLGANEEGDAFGRSMTATDVDRDGKADLVVGAPKEKPDTDPQSGYAFAYKGFASGLKAWFGLHQEL